MLQTVAYKLHDPYGKAAPREVANIRQVEAATIALGKKIVEVGEAQGKTGEALYTVCAIHKEKGIHRWFCIAWHILEPEMNHGVPSYAGAQSLLECLLDGVWRIGTPEEEKARAAQDIKDRENALAAEERKQAAGSMRAGEQFAAAVTAALKQAEPNHVKDGKAK